MWSKAKEKTPYKLLPKEVYDVLEERLENLTDVLYMQYQETYYIPACPKCGGILGHKCASTRLVCYRCGTEFELNAP
jgi:ribosomal protein S27AE